MLADFYPWKIDVDIEATKRFYDENDWSEDKAANQKFCDVMTGKQKQFFSALGIDVHKVKTEERVHEIPDEEETPGGKIYVRTLDFLFCGTFLSIPDYQWNLYNDEEIVGMRLPETLEVVEMPEGEKLPVYDIDGWCCVFKHPFFRMEEKRFKQWDCGYVLGSILLMKDI